jgi:uncharacterized integral membrane protein
MPPVLRPLALGELLDHTFQLYRKKFLLFVGIAAIPQLIIFAIQATGTAVQSFAAAGQPSPYGVVAMLAAVFGMLVALILYLVATALSQAATAIAVSETYMDREITIWGTYRRTWGRVFRLLGLMFGIGLLTVLGFLLLIVPGIYLMLTWCLAIPAAMIEDLGIIKAAKRSGLLVDGARWRMLLIVILVFALTYAVLIGLQMPIFALNAWVIATGGKTSLFYEILSQLAAFIAGSLVAPLGMIAFTLAYYDQRVRKEGFDIQLMMSSQMQASAAVAGNPGTAGD